MKTFFAFVKKEFFHIFRDRRTLLILFGMPVAQIILFGFAITNEIKDAQIAILDKSKDKMTSEISQRLLSSGYFKLSKNLSSDEEIEKTFKEGNVKIVVVFEPQFGYRFEKESTANVQILADATDPNTAATLINYATAIIKNYQIDKTGMKKLPYTIDTEVKMLYNPSLKGVFMFVPGVITIILMLVSAMMTSITIAREKELGTMEILLVSPLKPSLIIVGKVIPYILLAFINCLTILALGKYVFGMPLNGSLIFLLIECTLFIITSLSLGILISTVAETQQTAMMVSLMALMLPTIMLSGYIFPIASMPWPLQIISNIVPARWFIIIVKGIMLKGVGIQYLWKETLVLIGMTMFFILISIKKFKIRLG